jgi:hypothetical protein
MEEMDRLDPKEILEEAVSPVCRDFLDQKELKEILEVLV